MRKRVTTALTTLAATILAAGCATTQAAKPVTPPPPAPIVIQDPPTVIATQTVASLPDPQPIPPESLPREPAPEPAIPEPQPARAPRRATPQQTRAKEPEPQPAQPEVPVPAARTGPALVPSEPSVAGRDIAARIADVRARVQRLASHSTSKEFQLTQDRIASFLKLAEDSLARDDFRQANLQSNRALTLVQDLER